MKKSIYLLLIVLIPYSLLAQQRTITGKVTDAEGGLALTGVTVAANTTDVSGAATTTNAAGDYSIVVPAGTSELIFTFVGKKPVTEAINGRVMYSA